jgi:hypothetical protein
MLTGMGERVPPEEERQEEIEQDAGLSPFVLPPLVRAPLAGRDAKVRALLRVIEQAERERAGEG